MGNEAAVQQVGDYDLKGPDIETILIGPIHGTLIDAARLARREFRNGFPNWELYRSAYAGDTLHLRKLRQWCVAFAIAYAQEGGVKRSAYTDELACMAGWDAFCMLIHCRQMQPYTTTASELSVDPKTYKKLRDAVYLRLRASLEEYWVHLNIAYRQMMLYERKSRSQ